MPQRHQLVLKNVSIPGGRVCDVTIGEGRVAHAGSALPAVEIIDCTGFIVLPAAVDMHVHMRGGTQSAKEDWKSGTMSALAGGVTVVVDQPNTVPPLTTPERFLERVAEARAHTCCRYAINSAVTPDTPLEAMWAAGAMAFGETFCAPSSYGEALDEPALSTALDQIGRLGALATIHAEEVTPGADTDLLTHDTLRSAAGELRAIRNVTRCNTAGSRLHLCHASTADAVCTAPGTVEVTPHHLFLSREQFEREDTHAKVNPPLRSEHARKNLWSHWNQIDIIASDHAPHTRSEKQSEFERAPSGIPGVETMVPLLLASVLKHTITLTDLIKKTAITPSTLIGIPPDGFSPGDRADFAIYPKEISRVDPDTLHSKCGWTPFAGHEAVFPRIVIVDGRIAYNAGDFVSCAPLWIPGKGYQQNL